MIYKAAVIGLGQIGQGYDYDNNNNLIITTHSSAFLYHNSFSLVGGLDLNKKLCMNFEKKFSKPTFDNIDELMHRTNPDIVSIAVPTHSHHLVIDEIIDYGPKAILCEKPFTNSVKDATKIVEKAKKTKCKLIVNYIRRFEPGANELKNIINNGELGDILKGLVWYTKGLFNSCSHFIDLLIYIFGDASNIGLIKKGRKWEKIDPEPDFYIEFGNKTFYFIAGKEEDFHLNEMQLCGSKGMMFYKNGGRKIEYKKIIQNKTFKDYRVLSNKRSLIDTDFNRYQYHVLDNLVEYFEKGLPIKSDGKSAIKTLTIIEKIISKIS